MSKLVSYEISKLVSYEIKDNLTKVSILIE